MKSKFYKVNGQTIRVVEMGEGEPLLMINGITANVETWTPFAEKIKNRRLIMFDVPGIGLSPARRNPKKMHEIAIEMMALLTILGYDKVDILGYSWGGTLAQQIVHQFPERIKKVILVSTTPGIKGKFPTFMTIGMMASFASYVAATRVFNAERDYKELFIIPNPIGVVHQVFALAHWSFNGRTFNDSHEVLIIGGKKDPLLPHGNSWRIKKNFKNADVYIAPTGDHMWVLDSSETSSALVNNFLSGE